MPALPDPIDNPGMYCARLTKALTDLGVSVPPDEQPNDLERVSELLGLIDAWLLWQYRIIGEVHSAGTLSAAYARLREQSRVFLPNSDGPMRSAAVRAQQAEALLGQITGDDLDRAVWELITAANMVFTALFMPADEADLPELDEYDESGNGQHVYLPARYRYLTQALELVHAAADRLVTARSS